MFAASCTWISTYATFAELFPTPLRAIGVGLCVGVGRVGDALGVVGLSYVTTALGLLPAFVLLAVFFGLGAVPAIGRRRRGRDASTDASTRPATSPSCAGCTPQSQPC